MEPEDKVELKPITQKVLEEIRFILEGIKGGSLDHVQEQYHCGTAHCVAGWHQYFKLTKLGYTYKYFEVIDDNEQEYLDYSFQRGNVYEDISAMSPWTLAQEDWGLTNTEASILFSSGASLEEQFELLTLLERGERIEY